MKFLLLFGANVSCVTYRPTFVEIGKASRIYMYENVERFMEMPGLKVQAVLGSVRVKRSLCSKYKRHQFSTACEKDLLEVCLWSKLYKPVH